MDQEEGEGHLDVPVPRPGEQSTEMASSWEGGGNPACEEGVGEGTVVREVETGVPEVLGDEDEAPILEADSAGGGGDADGAVGDEAVRMGVEEEEEEEAFLDAGGEAVDEGAGEAEPLVDVVGEEEEESLLVETSAEEGVNALAEGAESLVGSAFLEEKPLVDSTGKNALDLMEQAEPLVGSAVEVESFVDATKERMDPFVDTAEEDKHVAGAVEPILDGTEEEEEEEEEGPVVDSPEKEAGFLGFAAEGKEWATVVDAAEKAEPSGDVAEEETEPLLETIVEEAKPSGVSAAETEPLGDAAEEDGEPVFYANEGEVEPVVDDTEEETRAVVVNGTEEAELLGDVTEEVEPLGDAMEEAKGPLFYATEEGGTEPLVDATEEGTRPVVDAEEEAEPLGDTAEEAETLGDAAVEVEDPVFYATVVGTEPVVDATEELYAAGEQMEHLHDAEEDAEHTVDAMEEEVEPVADANQEEADAVVDANQEAEPVADAIDEEVDAVADANANEQEAEPVADANEEEADAVADENEEEAEAGADSNEETEPVVAAMEEELDIMHVNEEEAEPLVDAPIEEAEPLAGATRRGGGRRKRGRPPKAKEARASSRRKIEEDVCFICFDGGELVVCDRRGCPKVYHPSCVNRDESFFRSKGRWNCGWHICSSCEKNAYYMCYTCTYSLCKGCIKEAKFVCVRGNKGLCETCMTTVMTIETKGSADQTTVFDDRNSWEYLFKDYWLDLKEKLSLTLEELTRAKAPRKGSSLLAGHGESSDELYDANDDPAANSDSSSGRREGSSMSRKKLKKRSRNTTNEEGPTREVKRERISVPVPEGVEWASKELLEFVAHMKDGVTTYLHPYEVQALLLEYIKTKNLRDPRKKSQIVCDSRLHNLFGKPRVGHFEMLKLLESHLLVKDVTQPVTSDSQGGVVDPDSSIMDGEGNSDASTKVTADKKRKMRKRTEEKEPQTNIDEYAAIDVHNINLMYLRRNLMEELLDDVDGFNEKVLGSFVRIRISGAGQKQDMYRLVQVVGTRKAEKYKTGKKTTDIILEILNLNKTEIASIDIISNQDFTEEECKRLRQSIKCGLIARLTVGDVQEKARVLQAVRVNDWLENEKLRLGHLRDRASEKGRRKELRECVEKLQLLSTPEERLRRLHEVPEIHVDPHMDPDYESAEDEGEPDDKKDSNVRPREFSSLRKTSSGKGGAGSGNNWNGSRKSSNSTWESNRNTTTDSFADRVDSFARVQGKDVKEINNWQNPKAHANTTSLEAGIWNDNQILVKSGQSSGAPPEATSTVSTIAAVSSNIDETEKLWHYQDPSGKIQGPFSMTQLRKWSTTGYFPPNLKIWKTSGKPEDSILLSDALIGKFQKDLPQLTKVASMTENSINNLEGNLKVHNNPTWVDDKQRIENWKGSRNDTSFAATGTNEMAKAESMVVQPSAFTAASAQDRRHWEPSINTNAWSGQMQGHNSPRPGASLSGSSYQSPSYQGRVVGGHSARWNGGQDHSDSWSSDRSMGLPATGQGHEKQHSNWSSLDQRSSGQQWAGQAADDSLKQWGNDSFNLPTPTPQQSSGGRAGAQDNYSNSSLKTPGQFMSPGWETSAGGIESHHSLTGTTESIRIAATANSVGWVLGSNSDALEVDGLSVFQPSSDSNKRSAPDATTHKSGPDLLHQNEIIPGEAANFNGASSRVILENKQCFESDCHSPTPISEQAASDVFTSGHSQGTPQLSNRQEFAVQVTLDGDRLRTNSNASEDILEKSLITEMQKSPINFAGLEDQPCTQVSGSMVIEPSLTPFVALPGSLYPNVQHIVAGENSNDVVSVPVQRSAAVPTLIQEPQSRNFAHAPARNGLAPDQSRRPELGVARFEAVNSGNFKVAADTRSGEWSMPSPTPTSKPSVWDTDVDSSTGNGQNNQLIQFNEQKQPAPPQWTATASIEPGQPSNMGFVAGANDIQSTGWGQAQQTPDTSTGVAQGAGNVNWGSGFTGNSNPGWANMAQGNVAWGIPAQGNANQNVGWAQAQVNSNATAGWGAPVQGNMNVNPSWVPTAQGSTNSNAGMGLATQGNTMLNTGWVTPTQGFANPQPGQNLSWGTMSQGNTNAIAGWTAGQGNINTNQDPSVGNPNYRNNEQKQNGDGHSNQGGSGFHRNDSGYGSGRQSWNRMQSGGGGGAGSSRPLRDYNKSGVCRFHESGYCKKGASCNYFHN